MLLGAGTPGGHMPVSMAGVHTGQVLPATPGSVFPGTPSQVFNTNGLQMYRPYGTTNGYPSGQLVVNQQGLIPTQAPTQSPAEKSLDSFYRNFHASHPFVLPRDWFFRILGDANVEPLLAAMRWVGSLFVDVGGPARANFLDEAMRLVSDAETKKDGFLVQALILLIVGTDGNCQQEKARQLLGEAERIAMDIELNRRDFAAIHGRGIPILEESWRRTWWDLYIVCGMVAGVHRQTNFYLFDVLADVALPCEEHQFMTAVSCTTGRHPSCCRLEG